MKVPLLSIACLLVLSACVPASTTSKVNNASKIITIEDAAQVRPGITVAELDNIMGYPTSTGVVDDKPYKSYAMIEVKSRGVSAFLYVAFHVNMVSYVTGHELQVFYENGVVTRVVRKKYVGKPGDNSE